MKKLPLISICIPLWERDEHFEKLIKSIKEHDAGMPYEICIGEGHNAACVNRNKAVLKAKSNYICQIDADAEIIQDGWLKKLYETLINNPRIGVVGCVIEFPTGVVDHCGTILVNDKKTIHNKINVISAYHKDYVTKFLKERVSGIAVVIPYKTNEKNVDGNIYSAFQCSGVCFLYDKRVTGLFLQIYKRAGWEDVDFFARVKAMGYLIVVDGRVRIKHPNHIRSKEEIAWRDPDSKRGFQTKNLLEYMIKWGAL